MKLKYMVAPWQQYMLMITGFIALVVSIFNLVNQDYPMESYWQHYVLFVSVKFFVNKRNIKYFGKQCKKRQIKMKMSTR